MSNKVKLKQKRRLPSVFNSVENKMVSAIDKKAKFEEWESMILPALQGQLKKGASSEDLYKLYEALATARQITIALTEADPGKALSAIFDIQNRVSGKPKEKLEVQHRYANLTDSELEALIESRMKDVTPDGKE